MVNLAKNRDRGTSEPASTVLQRSLDFVLSTLEAVRGHLELIVKVEDAQSSPLESQRLSSEVPSPRPILTPVKSKDELSVVSCQVDEPPVRKTVLGAPTQEVCAGGVVESQFAMLSDESANLDAPSAQTSKRPSTPSISDSRPSDTNKSGVSSPAIVPESM